MSEINELLARAKSAGDLRRKETLRLVEAGKRVSVAIVDAARDVGITVTVPLSPQEETLRRLAIVRRISTIIKDEVWWGLAVQEELGYDYAEEWRGKPFALATGTKTHSCWEVPEGNPYDLPAGAAYLQGRWLIYCGSQKDIPLTSAKAGEVSQWLPTLRRPLAEPPESLTRSQWIEVAGQLVPLAEKLAESAAQTAAETTTAADLAERLQNAL